MGNIKGENERHIKACGYWIELVLSDDELSISEMIHKTALKFKVHERTVKKWRDSFDWKEQANRKVREQNEETQRCLIEGIAKMNARHVKKTKEIQKQLIKQLKELKPQSISEGVKGYEILVAIERMARGEPASIEEVREDVPKSPADRYTDEQKYRIARFLATLNTSEE